MAKIKKTMTVSLEEFGKEAGEYALDEFEYKGLTIRQWADKITSGEHQPVKHGRWERRMTKIYACSECTNEVTDRQRQNYSFCPYCGALMNVVYEDDKVRAIKTVSWDGDSEETIREDGVK